MTTHDYTKDIEEEMARYAIPGTHKRKRNWRLLFVSDDGRVIQSGNYQRVVKSTLICLSVLALGLAATTSFWVKSRANLAEALLQEQKLTTTLTEQRKNLELLMARLAIAEEKVPPAPDANAKKVAPSKPQATNTPAIQHPFVRADGLESVREKNGTSLKVTFKLYNDTPNKSLAQGNMFLVFQPKKGSTASQQSIPAVRLKKGIPSEPKRGKSFQMRNFNVLTFRLPTAAGELSHSGVILYIFDRSGALRYKKAFKL